MRVLTLWGTVCALMMALAATPAPAGAPPIVTFRLVDESADIAHPPAGDEVLETACFTKTCTPQKLAVEKIVRIDSSHFKHVDVQNDPRTGRPTIAFEFDEAGRQLFAEITKRNVNRRLCIVIDGKVIASPVIVMPILGGMGVISGDFTIEEIEKLAERLRR